MNIAKTIIAIAVLAVPSAATDRPAVHGMLLFGQERIYLSHLPMFHSPHDYQVILEIAFDENVKAAYLSDKASSGERVYTFVPEPFVLPEILSGRNQLSGDVVRGHFERGGKTLLESISARIVRIVHFRRFHPAEPKPSAFQALLFGTQSELFLAHWIAAAPDFDQVISVKKVQAPPGEGAQTETIVFVKRDNDKALKEDEVLEARVKDGTATLRVGTEWYHETGDLSH
jgi:hypothetical protein